MQTAILFVLVYAVLVLAGAWLGAALTRAEEQGRSMFGKRRLPYGSDRP